MDVVPLILFYILHSSSAVAYSLTGSSFIGSIALNFKTDFPKAVVTF